MLLRTFDPSLKFVTKRRSKLYLLLLLQARKVDDVDIGKIFQWGTVNFPSSSKLWAGLLRYHLGREDEASAMAIFEQAKARPDMVEPINIWLLMLKYFQITDPARVCYCSLLEAIFAM